MKNVRFALVVSFLVALVGCGGSSSNSGGGGGSIPSMAGAWDFTATSPSFNGQGFIALEANLTQDGNGNISASGTATANGPTGNVTQLQLFGSSLTSVSDIQLDFLGSGDSCTANDNGVRSIAGTINASSQVTITYDNGGTKVNITGTYNSSAKTFSGTFTISSPGCNNNGQTGSVNGVMASSVAGNYAGTPVGSNNQHITFALTAGANNTFTGTGTDSVNGAFTLSGSSIGNGLSITVTPSGGGSSNMFFGYFDPQLGSKGVALSAVLVGPNAGSCPNGANLNGESCLYAMFAQQ